VSAPGPESGKRPAAVGAVLAGGAGSRVGGAKATLELGGRPLLAFPLEAVERAGLEPVVVAKRASPLPPVACPVTREPDRPMHPLCGVLAALEYAAPRAVVVVGCDMPFPSSRLLAWLGSAPEPLVVPSVHNRLQPLMARYGQELVPALDDALMRSQPMQDTVEALRPRVVAESELTRFGEPERLFFNVNTPADLERARRLLKRVER
jgi:molybdopterin-guanine dinucleotide biosynthesis protein A